MKVYGFQQGVRFLLPPSIKKEKDNIIELLQQVTNFVIHHEQLKKISHYACNVIFPL